MDFRHLIVTCLFSKLRLPFDNQKVKENYAIFSHKFGQTVYQDRATIGSGNDLIEGNKKTDLQMQLRIKF